ncbi:MAG: protein-glutamate O-methyltransferase CheR [Steroidobacteraceae bacterium]
MQSGANAIPDKPRRRDFHLSDTEFNEICRRVKAVAGIALSENKRELVYSRIARRLRALELDGFADYLHMLDEDDGTELVEFCNALTTNLTSFFRENHHFDYLREQVLRPRVGQAAASRRIRIWSSACSSGEEPYSIAMTVAEAIPDFARWDIKILATDIDSEMVARAKAGRYPEDRVRGMASSRLQRFFREASDAGRSEYLVSEQIRALITFKQLNLMQELPIKGPLDVIFCRNVVIYFDKDTQRQLFARFAPLQRKDQILFLGHSESLFKVSEDWELIGKTIYRRR